MLNSYCAPWIIFLTISCRSPLQSQNMNKPTVDHFGTLDWLSVSTDAYSWFVMLFLNENTWIYYVLLICVHAVLLSCKYIYSFVTISSPYSLGSNKQKSLSIFLVVWRTSFEIWLVFNEVTAVTVKNNIFLGYCL